MLKKRLTAVFIFIGGIAISYIVFVSSGLNPLQKLNIPSLKFIKEKQFVLGLDLKGGSHLVYKINSDKIASSEIGSAQDSLRDTIERRVNGFGVSEPVVQIENKNFGGIKESRLVVDLPGVSDLDQAKKIIGDTPSLDFRTERPDGAEKTALKKKLEEKPATVDANQTATISVDPNEYYNVDWLKTELTGKSIQRAVLEFNQTTNEPMVGLVFTDEGSKLFAKLTKENVGKKIGIFIDGNLISSPVVNQEIKDGQAQISGSFTLDDAKTLIKRLNSGALPVDIELISTEKIGPTLGQKAVESGVKAGLIGFLIIVSFLIFWYRFPGLLAAVSLSIYISIILSLFKLIPVTLSAAGIAGFIISIGIAVDANVLIFERIKEELRSGRTVNDALKIGFHRAWSSIRDSNISSMITAVILFWFGTSLIKGFALTLGLGVLISMLSSIIITRAFLHGIETKTDGRFKRFMFANGFYSGRAEVKKN